MLVGVVEVSLVGEVEADVEELTTDVALAVVPVGAGIIPGET